MLRFRLLIAGLILGGLLELTYGIAEGGWLYGVFGAGCLVLAVCFLLLDARLRQIIAANRQAGEATPNTEEGR